MIVCAMNSHLYFPGGSDGKESVYNAGDPGSIPGSGRSPREGNGNPVQYSCLESGGLQSMGSQRVRHDCATMFSSVLLKLISHILKEMFPGVCLPPPFKEETSLWMLRSGSLTFTSLYSPFCKQPVVVSSFIKERGRCTIINKHIRWLEQFFSYPASSLTSPIRHKR